MYVFLFQVRWAWVYLLRSLPKDITQEFWQALGSDRAGTSCLGIYVNMSPLSLALLYLHHISSTA